VITRGCAACDCDKAPANRIATIAAAILCLHHAVEKDSCHGAIVNSQSDRRRSNEAASSPRHLRSAEDQAHHLPVPSDISSVKFPLVSMEKRSRPKILLALIFPVAAAGSMVTTLWTPAGAAWTATTLGSPQLLIDSIACTAPGRCVGAAVPPHAKGQIAIETLASGVWTDKVLQLAAPLAVPSGVACTTTGNCLLVGVEFTSTGTSGRELGFYASEVAGVWAAPKTLPMLQPTASSLITNDAVSCAPNTSCTVLGVEGGSETCCRTFVESWSPGIGFSSSPIPLPASKIVSGVELSSISCPSAGSCVVVGGGRAHGQSTGIAVTWNGTTWGTLTSFLDPTHTSNFGFDDVSCGSIGNCAAVGGISTDHGPHDAKWVVELTGGTWGAPQTVPVPYGIQSDLAQEDTFTVLGFPGELVSCVGVPMTCTIVDNYLDMNSMRSYAVTAQSSNGVWGQFTMLPAHVAPGREWEVLTVSCVPGPSCVAAGDSVNYRHQPFRQPTRLDRSFRWLATGTPPSRPRSARASVLSTTEVKVSWAPPTGGAPVDHYNVWADMGLIRRTYPVATKDTNIVLLGLSHKMTYTFEVQAIGRDGEAMAPVATAAAQTR